jgi:hypothetical protein
MRTQTQISVLILNNKNLTIQIVRKLKLVVFTWHGFTPSDVYRQETIQSLEILRDNPSINRILLNKKDHSVVMHEDITASVESTVDYLAIAQGNYRMAVVPPTDLQAKTSVDFYVDSLNQALKKRFVVKQYRNSKEALSWLTKAKFWLLFLK